VARAGFFDDNRNRAYPFITGTAGRPISGVTTLINLPNSAIVDCGFTFGPNVDFDHKLHVVYLKQLRRVGNAFFFEFASTCPALAYATLTFTRTTTSDAYLTEFTDSGLDGLSLSGSEVDALIESTFQSLWTGFLVTGPLDELTAFVASNTTLTGTLADCVLEPALTRSSYKSAVTSINVANNDRTRYENPDYCPELVWPFPTNIIFIDSVFLRDLVLFQPGYNADIKQNIRDGSITFAAKVGAGEGQPCEEIPLFETEVPLAGISGLLSGGPACGETIQTINGVSKSNFTIQGSNGVQIESVPEENKLIIDINLAGVAVVIPESLSPA
jgi:hypothetical protein